MIQRTAVLACLVSSFALAQEDHGQGPVEPGPIHVADLNLGRHWFGPEVDKQDLIGKVVLVEIWGSRVGCKAVTPHLVSLAKRLEGKPFHLLATHCQRDTQDNVVAYVKSKGLADDTSNFTVSSFGGHPKVKGNGYVPYYMVFDHHGDLVHHHMCGDYHGGDGLRMIELVDELLESVPAIYLGSEPFVELKKLARQVGQMRQLPAALREIDRRRAESPSQAEAAELDRLTAAIDDYRTRMLESIEKLHATDPTAVVPRLRGLIKHFVGTPVADELAAQLATTTASKDHQTAIKLYKSYAKTMAKLAKGEPSAKQKRSAVKKLEKLIDGHDALPIVAKIRTSIDALRD